MLDLTKTRDAHIEKRLGEDLIMWLSTVRPDGRPHLVPVWFLWDGNTILIFSQPENQKIRNIRHNPHVVLSLETGDQGDDVVLIEGEAALIDEPDLNPLISSYAEKYDLLLRRMNETAERMASAYTQAIRIKPSRFLSW